MTLSVAERRKLFEAGTSGAQPQQIPQNGPPKSGGIAARMAVFQGGGGVPAPAPAPAAALKQITGGGGIAAKLAVFQGGGGPVPAPAPAPKQITGGGGGLAAKLAVFQGAGSVPVSAPAPAPKQIIGNGGGLAAKLATFQNRSQTEPDSPEQNDSSAPASETQEGRAIRITAPQEEQQNIQGARAGFARAGSSAVVVQSPDSESGSPAQPGRLARGAFAAKLAAMREAGLMGVPMDASTMNRLRAARSQDDSITESQTPPLIEGARRTNRAGTVYNQPPSASLVEEIQIVTRPVAEVTSAALSASESGSADGSISENGSTGLDGEGNP
jgi:hypothetical protein